MKIASLEARVLGNPWKNWVLVKLVTDDGIIGWGDATTPMTYKPVLGAIEEMAPLCVGKDPRQIERLWEALFTTLYLPNDGTLLSAMAGIETACWDVLGKSLDVPLHQLLGGRVHDRIKAYANGWYNGPRSAGAFADKASEVVALGYRALKFDPFGSAFRVLDPAERKISLDIVRAVRERLGDGVDLMIEVHDRLTVPEAIRICRELEEFRPLWVEAPVWSTDTASLASVAAATPLRIVAGERFTNLADFADLLATRRVDVVQPEYVELGGVHRLRQVAAMAESYQAMIAPHNARCPLSTAVNVHVDAATRNVFLQETFDDFHVPWARDLFDGIPKIKDGYLTVPEGPGISVGVNEALIDRYPPGTRNYMNLFNTGWEQRFTQ
ncbi:MAG TPA: mandelate racemase/muconate lactonizing enzyme family protein [Bauldia sp.]|nr:mandelate racemase/muconate lactonizing enzyme family protein [Bauldia sp.]